MVGEDVTSSALELPPKKARGANEYSEDELKDIATRVISATWKGGLPQWSWGEGVYLLAQIRYHQLNKQEIPSELISWYQRQKDFTLGHINNVAPGAGALQLEKCGLFDAGRMNRALIDWLSDTNSVTRDKDGTVEHWPGSIWADTCYMLGTYYLNYAVVYKDVKFLEIIEDQLIAHHLVLQNPKTHLMAHGSHGGKTIWNYWGRGNAWMALSAVEFLDAAEVLAYKSEGISKIKSSLDAQLTKLCGLLPEYGIWDVLVDGQIENKGVLETSATAGIGAAMVRAARHLTDKKVLFLKTGKKAAAAALTYVADSGVLERTSAGTVLQLIPFGYSVIRSDRMQLWGQGLALNAIISLQHEQINHLDV
jgi:unsaturated rhamnogalacturonyl hydrolase